MTLLITPDDIQDLWDYFVIVLSDDTLLQEAIDSLDSPEQQRRIRAWLATEENIQVNFDAAFLLNFHAIEEYISSAWQRSAN